MTMYDLLKMFCEQGPEATQMWLTAAGIKYSSSHLIMDVPRGNVNLGMFMAGNCSVSVYMKHAREGECVQANWCKYKSHYPTYDILRPDLKKALMEAQLT